MRNPHSLIPVMVAVAIGLIVAACFSPTPRAECPWPTLESSGQMFALLENPKKGFIDVPTEIREPNYSGGSCVHASMITVLRTQGQDEVAEWWRKQYRGGESLGGLVEKANDVGLQIAYTGSGDTAFLDWVDRTNRAAVIFYYPNHSITFAGFEEHEGQECAVLIDNNRTRTEDYVPKDQFLRAWKGYGGVALSPVYDPLPPEPKA